MRDARVGATGEQGIQGEHGDIGERGDTGERGREGQRGESGDRGQPGRQGASSWLKEMAIIIPLLGALLVTAGGAVVTVLTALRTNAVVEDVAIKQARNQEVIASKVEEVHKVVNSKSDAALAENQALGRQIVELNKTIARLETLIGVPLAPNRTTP